MAEKKNVRCYPGMFPSLPHLETPYEAFYVDSTCKNKHDEGISRSFNALCRAATIVLLSDR